MAFEIYKPRGERSEKPPLITISKNSIVINKPAREKLGSISQIELSFDRDTQTIRIRAAAEGGQTLKKTKVFAKGFFNHFNIDKRGKYVASFKENEKALYVKIG